MECSNTTRKIENLILAAWRWNETPPNKVALYAWKDRCLKCFGGHLATWPEFQAMGVQTGPDGAPTMANYTFSPNWGNSHMDLSQELFGKSTLFTSRNWARGESVDRTCSDWELIRKRLEDQFVVMTEKEAEEEHEHITRR